MILDQFRLDGKVALVTGGNRGLGLGMAAALAEAGADVVRVQRSAEAPELAARVEAAGRSLLPLALDLADPDAAHHALGATLGRFGRVDVLVNNACVLGPRVAIEEYPEDEWRRVIDANLTGPFLVSKRVVPLMPEGGSIVNVVSGVSVEGRAEWGAYSVSKFGVEGLTQILAAELRDRRIRANAVDPGGMRTSMRAAAYRQEDPQTRITPEENTAVFLYLASDGSREVTGQRFKAQEFRPA